MAHAAAAKGAGPGLSSKVTAFTLALAMAVAAADKATDLLTDTFSPPSTDTFSDNSRTVCEKNPVGCMVSLTSGAALQFLNTDLFERYRSLSASPPLTEFRGVAIPPSINSVMMKNSIMTPFTYDFWVATLRQESGKFRENVVNSDSGATGILQITGGTLAEALYHTREYFPFIEEAWGVELIKTARGKGDDLVYDFSYEPVGGKSLQELENGISKDAAKSSFVMAAYWMHYARKLQEHFDEAYPGKRVTERNIYQIQLLGFSGTKAFIDGMEKDPSQPAVSIFAKGGKDKRAIRNRSLFFKDPARTQPLSFAEAWHHIGDGEVKIPDTPVPDLNQWTMPSTVKVRYLSPEALRDLQSLPAPS